MRLLPVPASSHHQILWQSISGPGIGHTVDLVGVLYGPGHQCEDTTHSKKPGGSVLSALMFRRKSRKRRKALWKTLP